MKAFTKTQYGGPEILQLEDVEKPSLKDGHYWLKSRQIRPIPLTGIFFGENHFLHDSLSDYSNQKIKFWELILQAS
jgi:NADPH:quinone reductase-like Zn-dependent oxidoreductase